VNLLCLIFPSACLDWAVWQCLNDFCENDAFGG